MTIQHSVEYSLVFFFFKQKTACEMRIRDWSSDVCSSDLIAALFVILFIYGWNQCLWPLLITTREDMYTVVMGIQRMANVDEALIEWNLVMATAILAMLPPILVVVGMQRLFVKGLVETEKRSEEHTSELQSLMRNSYAVFCLKKKIQDIHKDNKHTVSYTSTNTTSPLTF